MSEQRGENARPKDPALDVPMRMHEKPVLNVVSRLMIPFILLFALYVQFHGDFGPGGGFQAGVIFAAALVLYALVFGLDRLEALAPALLLEVLIAVGVLLFAGVGVVSFFSGEAYLDYDGLPVEHGQHLGILLVELGVGITVAASMVKLFTLFAGLARDEP